MDPLSTSTSPRTGMVETPGCNLSHEEVREFRQILAVEAGVSIPEHEAWGRAIELITLVRMLLGPIPEDPETQPRMTRSKVPRLVRRPLFRQNGARLIR